VIDYIQLLQASGRRGGDNRVQEVTEITNQLKAPGAASVSAGQPDFGTKAAFRPVGQRKLATMPLDRR
jgi:hypothetical protein